ncbi:MAG: ABC transporter ATP-binding protein [Saprospiraceae bacterium]
MSLNNVKKQLDLSLLRKVLLLSVPYRALFINAAVLTVVIAPLAPYRSFLIQKMVDEHIAKADITGLTIFGLLVLGILLLEAVLLYFFTWTTNKLGQNVIRDLRVRVFRHITSLRLQYFDTNPIGTSTTRTINDLETINTVFSEGIITITADILTLILVLIFMLYTSWKLTLVCLITAPFLIIASYIFKEKVKGSFQRVRSEVARMNAFLQERISGMKTIQIFNAESEELNGFKKINKDLTKANIDGIFYYAVFFPVVEILSAAALGLMVWYGAGGVVRGDITIGVLVVFPVYIAMFFRPIRMLADKFNTLQMGLVAAERVFRILEDRENLEKTGKLKINNFNGLVEFEKVSFSYSEGNPVLRDINFTIKPEESLAIVGNTGSGKTTIINLLNRFYEINSGKIKIDGTDIREIDLESLRNRIAIVLQDVFLFSGSVLENITLRNKNISREQAIEAAKMIGAHDFIEKLPGGYDYMVMERGATLSMGQRQLISFVRALVFDPDILILDEATSAIDPETEAVIQYAIEKLISKRTSIIIAHRLSTIRHATNVMVLAKGEIIEMGTHTELITNKNGLYKELYEMQFLKQTTA